MKTSFTNLSRLRFVLLVGTYFVLHAGRQTARADDQTINGSLGVTGEMDVYGNTLNLGSWANDATKFGLGLVYSEDASHAATLKLTTTRPNSGWLWQQAAPAGGAGSVPKMRLSPGNALTLYDQASPAPNAVIVLDPMATSTFGTNTTFKGTNNLMPNQAITGLTSVLTVGLADARYLVSFYTDRLQIGEGANASELSIALGYNAYSAEGSLAVGNTASATNGGTTAVGSSSAATGDSATSLGMGAAAAGQMSSALGAGSSAPGDYSVALGSSTYAIGSSTLALGTWATAYGDYAAAIGASAGAGGVSSLALGTWANASADCSMAIGVWTDAGAYASAAIGNSSTAFGMQSVSLGFASGVSGNGSTSLGLNSSASGNYSMALGTFSNASGSYATALASSSVASGDYSTAGGRTTASSYFQFAVGAYGLSAGNAHTWIPTDDLFTVGNGTPTTPSNAFAVKKNGDTKICGTLTVVKALLIQPQGDLSMGEFTASPSPAP